MNYLDGVQNSFATLSVDPRNLQFEGINLIVSLDSIFLEIRVFSNEMP